MIKLLKLSNLPSSNELLGLFVSNTTETFDSYWILYSHFINIILISFFIILLGIILPNKAKIIKFLNITTALYLLIFFYLFNWGFDFSFLEEFDTKIINQYISYTNLFIIISTITVFLFFLSISDIFYLEENMKIEYTLLILYVYLAAVFLINTSDFIAIIILLECIAFSSYILVGFERKNKFSTSSGLKYLILASVPSGFFILGISMLYHNYGTFNLESLVILLNSYNKNNTISTNNWIFIQNFYECPEYLYPDSGIFEGFDKYAKNFDEFLVLHRSTLMFYIMDLEALLALKPYLWDYTSNELHMMDDLLIQHIENLYIDFYSRYLFIIQELNKALFIWEYTYYILTGKTLDGNDLVLSGLYSLYDKYDNTPVFPRIGRGILDWLGFFSYNSYVISKLHENTTMHWFLAFFGVNTYQQAIISQLTLNLFNPDQIYFTPAVITSEFFWNSVKTYNNISINHVCLNINHFFEVCVQYIMNSGNISLIKSFIASDQYKIYENYMVWYNGLTWSETWYNYTKSQLLNLNAINSYVDYYKEFYRRSGYSYDNIFLITYLIIIFMLVNISFKITAAPFHFWAPSIYGGSPLPTITFLSVFSKLTIIFLFINLFMNTFNNLKFIWQPIVFFLGTFSIIISVMGAFSEKIFKRFFVYSSVGHVGFMILGIAVLNYDGIQGTIDYLILYIISSFIVWFIVMHLTKKTTHLISFKGLSYNYPTLSWILVITLFSISGLPPMGGFFVKFEIFYSLISSSQYFIGYLLFLLTVISFFYYLRLIKIIYFEDNKSFKKNKNLNDIKLRLISILIFILPLYPFLVEEPLFEILKRAIIESF